jgi:glycerol uptake facilitator protein
MEVYLAEFVGTLLLIVFGGGVCATVTLEKSKGKGGGWIVVTTGWALGVALAIYSVGRISGAHINPAVTVGLASIGSFPWSQVPGYVIAQLVGAFSGAVIVWIAYFPHWSITQDPADKLGIFSTIPAVREPKSNLASEIIGSAVLVFVVLALGDNAQSLETPGDLDLTVVYSGGIQPLIVGFLVWAIGLSLGGATGYAINPARDLGPRLAHFLLPIAGKGSSDWGYSWIPIVGPITGGIIGAYLYYWLAF